MIRYTLPSEADREPKFSFLYMFINIFHAWTNNPNYHACYFLAKIYNVVVLLYFATAFGIYYCHRYLGFFQDIMEKTGSENYFELYLELIDYSAYPTFFILFAFLFWLNKKFNFKDYDYARPKPAKWNKKFVEKARKSYKPYSLFNKLMVFFCSLLFLCFAICPSMFGTFFYQSRFDGVFVSYFDNTSFILFAGLFIAFWQNWFFQFLLISAVYFLSSINHLEKDKKE